MSRNTFLGRGWSFPPTFNANSRSIEMVEDDMDVKQSLQILLSTQLGERILRSDFGCNLTPLLFENVTVTLLTRIREIIKTSILAYEPRIDLINIFFDDANTAGLLRIEIEYLIRTTNSRQNYVFPFYLEEGTYVNGKL
jgi:phage baseplate assembly protein W